MHHSQYSFMYVNGIGLPRMMRVNDIETLDTSGPATTTCVHVFALVLFALVPAVGKPCFAVLAVYRLFCPFASHVLHAMGCRRVCYMI